MLNAADGRDAAQTEGAQVPHRADPERIAFANSQPIATDRAPDVPAFLDRSSGFGLQPPMREVSYRRNLLKALARLSRIWRGHLVQDPPNTAVPHKNRGIGGGTFALLTLLVLAICAGGLLALAQIRSLKAEIASLQRELLPLRERLASFEQAEKARQAEIRADAETNKALAEKPFQPAPLAFSREEVQLIREYIKPAPSVGPALPAANVGDPVTGGTVPLPSSLAEKMPKLAGARFAIQNGAIIIVRKDSRKVDAVLPPY